MTFLKNKQNVFKFLFLLFVFSIPFGTKKFLFSFTMGVSELTSAFLYGTDILLVLFLAFFFFSGSVKYSNVLKNIGIELEREMGLLTAKKQIFLLNGDEKDTSEELKSKIRDICAEFVVANLGPGDLIPESFDGERVGMIEPLIQKAYKTLNLISFFTTGEDETRAWTIERGTKAPQAAGVIHTDFEHKFIRAEAVNWQKLLEAGGWHQAKQKGWLRLEGKEYIVQDGDVIVVRHG